MSTSNLLNLHYPALAEAVPSVALARLPTALRSFSIASAISGTHRKGAIWVKDDSASGRYYGGNKVRKLEYLFGPAAKRAAKSVATFGAAGSNHALATAIYAQQLGLGCHCFLSHQPASAQVTATIAQHLTIGSRLHYYGGSRESRRQILRNALRHERCLVIPAGGSSWRGTLGFVNAGLELARQIEEGEAATPDHLYIASGTLGSAAGLGIGLALAGLRTRVHAVRVSATPIANEQSLDALICRTVAVLRRFEPAIPKDLVQRINVTLRHEFFAGGYALSDKATDSAVRFAGDELGLALETTYTGKAMAALRHDLALPDIGNQLFWNTFNAIELPKVATTPAQRSSLPQELSRYLP